MKLPALVFTDLDGTLLDHHTYQFSEAESALNRLKAESIPVILNSSKTLEEMKILAEALAPESPIIAENGSLIFNPVTRDTQLLGPDYVSICRILNQLRDRNHYPFMGFQDWSIETLSQKTGLDLLSAAHAKKRSASEPILWHGSGEHLLEFKRDLADYKLTLKQGGRFWHVMGETDKVTAMQALVKQYTATHSIRPTVIALGDGPNDLDMLRAADIGVIVNNPSGTPISLQSTPKNQIIKTQEPGPKGWNTAILQILAALGD